MRIEKKNLAHVGVDTLPSAIKAKNYKLHREW